MFRFLYINRIINARKFSFILPSLLDVLGGASSLLLEWRAGGDSGLPTPPPPLDILPALLWCELWGW